jgi:uncharacterized membrane protein
MADIDSQIAAAEEAVKRSEKAVEDLAKRQQADDRSHIAKLIIWAFVLLMGIVVAAVIVNLSNWNAISESAKFLLAILSSVMLPVVTLVIGHYFGSKQ